MKYKHIVLVGTALATSLFAGTSFAQDAANSADAKVKSASDKSATVSEVIVTGTRIRKLNATSGAPVSTVDRQELQFQGALNVEDALNRMPQVRAESTQFTNTPDSNGQAKVNLHNLGWERTLILMDGQRLGPVEGIDLNMVPAALVKKIDILTGGASATYGSDAVSGVINFMMDKKFKGIDLNASYGFYQHENDDSLMRNKIAAYPNIKLPKKNVIDGDKVDLSFAAGTDFHDGRGNISIFGGYRNQDPVRWGDRDYSACRIVEAGSTFNCSINSLYSEYGSFNPSSGPNAGKVMHLAKDGSQTFVTGDAPYAYNTRANWNFIRSDERYTGGLFANYKFNDAIEVYGSALYMNDESSSQFVQALTSNQVDVNCNNPYMSAAQAQSLCGTDAGTNKTVSTQISYHFNNPGRPFTQNQAKNESHRIVVGMRGEIFDGWHYDVNLLNAGVVNTQTDSNEIVDERFVRAAQVVNVNGTPTCVSKVNGTDPNCVPVNLFQYHAASKEFFDYASMSYHWVRRTYMQDLNANITGSLEKYGIKSPWANEGVSVAVGAEYRRNSLRNIADAATIAAVGWPNNNAGTFDAKEGYGELAIPVVSDKAFINKLDLNLGYRLSKYQNQKDTLPTSKVEVLYRPIKDLLVRASFNEAAHAPNITQLYTNPNLNGSMGGGDPCAGPTPTRSLAECKNTGVTDAQYGKIQDCPDGNCRVVSYDGNPNLKPETAETKTFGLVYTPHQVRGLMISVDYYDIQIKDFINYVSANDFFNRCLQTGLQYYCRAVHRDKNTGALYGVKNTGGYVEGGWYNTYYLMNKGVDVQVSSTFPIGTYGKISNDFLGTYLVENGAQDSPILKKHDNAGYFGIPVYAAQPRWRHNLRTTWNTPWMGSVISLNWRFIGGTSLGANSSDPDINQGQPRRTLFTRLKAYNYFDLSGSVKLRENVTLRLSVNNIFDKNPPLVPSTYVEGNNNHPNTYTGLYDPLGRSFLVSLNVKM